MLMDIPKINLAVRYGRYLRYNLVYSVGVFRLLDTCFYIWLNEIMKENMAEK